MIKIGVIHISSGSLRLVLAEIEEIGYFRVIDELKTQTPFSNTNASAYLKLCLSKISETAFSLSAFRRRR